MAGRAGRVVGGCLLFAVGSVVALTALVWLSLESAYGGNRWWAQLIFYGVLAAGLTGLGWGIVLMFRRPPARTDV